MTAESYWTWENKSESQKRRQRRHIKIGRLLLGIIQDAGEEGINIKDMTKQLNDLDARLGFPSSNAIGNHLAILRRRCPDAVERFFHSIKGWSETYYRWTAETETVMESLNRVYGYIGNED